MGMRYNSGEGDIRRYLISGIWGIISERGEKGERREEKRGEEKGGDGRGGEERRRENSHKSFSPYPIISFTFVLFHVEI